MFQALTNYLASSNNKVITKDEMISAVEVSFTAISKNILPAFKAVEAESTYFDSDKAYILGQLGGSLGLTTTNPKDVIKELARFFKDVHAEEKSLNKLINTQTNEKIFTSMATAQEVAIMATISDISSVTLFALDLLYYIVLPENTEYPKKKLEMLQQSIHYFTSIVKVYINKFDKHVDTLYKVSKTVVKKGSSVAMMDKLLAKQGRLATMPVINGFIGNPIYHVRLWFVDRDVDKYESLKEKRKLLELRLLDLKMQSAGKHDERLAKQIAYYEDKVASMEYDIKELGNE